LEQQIKMRRVAKAFNDLDIAFAIAGANTLPSDYSSHLNPFVREKFIELWQAAQISEDY
jgi:hypothetical protein